MRYTTLPALLTLVALTIASVLPAQAATQINGAGATFPNPLYSKWFAEYRKARPEVQINYQAIGSGGGIQQFLAKTIDFGATDAPMTDEQLGKATAPVVHVPTVLGAVVVTYNLPEAGALKLAGDIVADLFLGTIKTWNDPRIVKLNPTAKLPATPVSIVHRSDGSGTSAVFTDYLAKISPDWKTKVGAGTAVAWPAGLGGKGNDGVTALVKQTPGSIGYVELIYAEMNKLPIASLKNKAGQYPAPSTKSVTAAAAAFAKKIPDDFRISITDADGKDSYPISAFTYLLVDKTMKLGAKGAELIAFLKWAVTDGQSFAEPLAYAPLPKELVARVKLKIQGLKSE